MLDRQNNSGMERPYLANVNVRWREFDLSNLKTTRFEPHEEKRFSLLPGDIILCEGGEPGRCAIWREPDTEIKYQKALHRIRTKLIVPEFVELFFEAVSTDSWFHSSFTGSTIKHLPLERVESLPFPLPPFAEQHRIVTLLENLHLLCTNIEEDNAALRDLAKSAKSRILDLAIRGALVPQDPADEPASALLSRIRATADKPPCPKQGPFDIPATWEWTTLESIGEVIRGSGIKRSEISTSGKPCIRYGEIYTTYYLKTKSVASSIPPALFNASKHASPRSILMTLTGEDRKDIAKTIAYLGEEEIAISGDMLCVCPREVEPLYLSFVLNSPWAIERKGRLATGDLVIHISAKTMSAFLIPLPPLDEQRRIVAKVEELFAAIDQALG